MKRIKLLADIMIAIMFALLLIMFLEFLATTDIYNCYVNKTMVENYAPESINAFPSFSNATSEWKMANFSLGSRIILIITSLTLAMVISYKIKEEETGI